MSSLPRLLEHRSDFIFHRHSGEIEDHADYTVIRTPANPGFFWGNYLLFKRAPRTGDAGRWLSHYRHHFPDARHIAIAWDESAVGDVEQFLQAGKDMHLRHHITMAGRDTEPSASVSKHAECRIIRESEWDMLIDFRAAANTDYPSQMYLDYVRKEQERHRRMQEQGLGAWFGAFQDGALVCTMGLFHDGALAHRIARYQDVETHPNYRRQGLCGALLRHVALVGVNEFGAEQLVIVANAGDIAASIYQRAGFAKVEENYSLECAGEYPRSL